MTTATFKTKAERDAHLAKYREAEKVAMELWDAEAPEEEVDDANDRAKELKQDYIPRLPVLPMSICPICGETFIHRIDPFGFDGLVEVLSQRQHFKLLPRQADSLCLPWCGPHGAQA